MCKRKNIIDFIYLTLGSFLYSAAVTVFLSANKISPGGFTGIATALNYLFSVPSGPALLLLNIPVLILGFLSFGRAFILKTAAVTALSSFFLSITDYLLPAVEIDKILAAVFGGILMGTGLSLVMLRGATTGGVDILAKLINCKMRHLTVGKLILLMDSAVIALSAVVYGSLESALYSVIALYASSYLMDIILYGADKGKLMYIVTECPREICADVTGLVGRGVTVLEARGGYTGAERALLLCTVRRHEVSAVYEILEIYDKNAFVAVCDVGEIIGEGFKPFGRR